MDFLTCTRILVVSASFAAVAAGLSRADTSVSAPAPMSDTAVREFHFQSFVMDLHTDTLLAIQGLGYDFGVEHWPPFGFMPWMTHVDLPRARKGGLDALFMGIVANPLWGDGPTQIRKTLEVAHSQVLQRYPDQIELAWHASDLTRITSTGRTAVQFLVEGAHGVGGNLAILDDWYKAGVRVLGLAHFTSNQYAASSADEQAVQTHLSPAGKQLVRHLNDIGMAVDLAHVHPDSFRDVLQVARAPVIVSHTGIAALKESFRNLQDWQIKAVAASNGVIGIMYAPVWLSSHMYPPVDRVVEHMLHVKQLVGARYLALGSDFDGFIWLPRGMWDVTDLPVLTAAMFRSGFTAAEVEGILGGNIVRTLKAIEAAATVHIQQPEAGFTLPPESTAAPFAKPVSE